MSTYILFGKETLNDLRIGLDIVIVSRRDHLLLIINLNKLRNFIMIIKPTQNVFCIKVN